MGLRRIFKQILRNFFQWVVRSDDITAADIGSSHISSTSKNYSIGASPGYNLNNLQNGLNFTIFNAVGGKIVQFSVYNPKLDRTNTNLYIITDKENLGEELEQIITRECLVR